MYELIKLTEHDYYIDCPAKIGLVRTGDSDVVLIDSGNDKDAGKKVLRVIQDNGWNLKAIYNTHSHADHVGGNQFLQEKTGCSVYAYGIENAFTAFTILEPACLYGGRPFKDIKNKFLMAKESKVTPLTAEMLPAGMHLLELRGHSADMAGYLTADGTAYVGDCVASEETLGKYGVTYLWDPEESIRTLEYVKTIDAARFVPAHAAVTEDISRLSDVNILAIKEIENRLLDMCGDYITFDNLLKKVFDEYGLTMTMQQNALVGSTIRSFLSSMCDRGLVQYEFRDNIMNWKIAEN